MSNIKKIMSLSPRCSTQVAVSVIAKKKSLNGDFGSVVA